MFQNIAENTMQNENFKRNMKILLILKELFKPQNVIAYVLTFLISMINIKGAYIPLGLAMVAAALGSTVPAIGIYLCGMIGTGVALGADRLASFFWISIVYYILLALFKPKVCVDERNEVYKTGSRLFFAYVFNLLKPFLIRELINGIIEFKIIFFIFLFILSILNLLNGYPVKSFVSSKISSLLYICLFLIKY